MIEQSAIWKLVISIPVMFILPGFAILRCIDAHRKSNLIPSEIIYLSVALSVATSAIVGLILAELSWYSTTKLLVVLVLFSVPLLLYAFLKDFTLWPSHAREKKWWTIAVLALLVLASALFIRGSEYVWVVREPARYLAWGTNIAKSGNLRIYNNDVPSLTPQEFKLLYGAQKTNGVTIEPGWRVKDVKTGRMDIDYFPLYGVVLAIWLKLIGLKNTLILMNPFLALLGLFGIVFAVRRLLDAKTAIVAGLLLALNGLMIYFSRYPAPEIFAQFLLFLGLLLFAYYLKSENGLWGAASAIVFGLSFTARYDLYPVLIPIVLACAVIAAVRMYKGESLRYLLWFIVPLVLVFIHSVWSQWRFSYFYLKAQFAGTTGGKIILGILALLAVLTVGILLLGYAYKRYQERIKSSSVFSFITLHWRAIFAGLLIAGFLYAYFIRPHIGSGFFPKISLLTEGRMRDSLVWIFMYLTPLAFFLVLSGILWFTKRKLSLETLPFFFISMFFTIVLVYGAFCRPQHIWFMRRYIVVVVPFLLIMAAYAITETPRALKWKPLYLVSFAALLALVITFAQYDKTIVPYVEFKGALGNCEDLAAVYQPSLLINGNPEPPPAVMFQGQPAVKYYPETMRHVFGIKAFPCYVTESNAPVLGKLVQKWSLENRRSFLLSSDKKLPRLWPGCWPEYKSWQNVPFTLLNWVFDRRPDGQSRQRFPLTQYQLAWDVPRSGYVVNIGRYDDENFMESGFFLPEISYGTPVRWTSLNPILDMPTLPGQQHMQVTLRLGLGARTDLKRSVPVDVFVDGKQKARFDVSTYDLRDFQFVIDPGELAKSNEGSFRLELKIPPWVPSTTGSSTDNRWLGVHFGVVNVDAY